MNIPDIHIGDRLVHRTNPLLSGPVAGVDLSGPVRPAGPCVWIDHIGRQHGPWLRVGEAELAEYDVHPKAPEPKKET
jgi:hypothetical protein